MADHTSQAERAKYERMWSRPEYRQNSPGLNAAPDALYRLSLAPAGATLIDYGCGEGLAVDWFREQGVFATGVDIVALRPDVVEACLWELPEDLGPSHFAYCADVMEHLPEERVSDVLEAIADRTLVKGYFTVATVECTVGRRFGEELHLTVRPRIWWEARFREAWSEVFVEDGDREWRMVVQVMP